MIDQPPLHFDDVADGDGGEVGGIAAAGGRVDGVGPGRAAAAAQDVRTNDEVAIGVDGLARANQDIPPAGVIVGVVPGNVRIARKRMADQHGVVALRAKLAVGLEGHGHFRQLPAKLQFQRLAERQRLGILQRSARPNAITAIKNVRSHYAQEANLDQLANLE